MNIEIKNGDNGVSHAIKRQLKEEGVNTSKINSCWSQIMNAFQGDNESKANGKKISEQWNSLKANVEVNVGQVITIAQETWNKIKDIVSNAAKTDSGASSKGADGEQSTQKSRTGYAVTTTEKDGSHWEEGKTKHGTTTHIKVSADNKKQYVYETDQEGNPTIFTEYDKNEKPDYTNKFKNGILASERTHKTGKTSTFTVAGKKQGDQYILKCSDGSYVLYTKGNLTFDDFCDKDGNPI